jgi:hypothetical protein
MTGHNSVGLSFDAQPAQEAIAVKRYFFFFTICLSNPTTTLSGYGTASRLAPLLYRIDGAAFDTGPAIGAHLLIDKIYFVPLGNRFDGTFGHARTAADTAFVYYIHLVPLHSPGTGKVHLFSGRYMYARAILERYKLLYNK